MGASSTAGGSRKLPFDTEMTPATETMTAWRQSSQRRPSSLSPVTSSRGASDCGGEEGGSEQVKETAASEE
ncbi:hypothetical protein BRADI_4g09535v3 [Brachypodium distachyon]|uniref:Uncharacterized protein n=1 Tax=Brachypodium distachyon TaxID=15368 RepID=A0A2K2CLL6_BRADI|nr:hypothetical protein BRADI_4g09535v3 [Brachypodium distachyon]